MLITPPAMSTTAAGWQTSSLRLNRGNLHDVANRAIPTFLRYKTSARRRPVFCDDHFSQFSQWTNWKDIHQRSTFNFYSLFGEQAPLQAQVQLGINHTRPFARHNTFLFNIVLIVALLSSADFKIAAISGFSLCLPFHVRHPLYFLNNFTGCELMSKIRSLRAALHQYYA